MRLFQSAWRELADAEPLGVDLALGAHEPGRDLLARHLEREDRDGDLLADGQMGRDVERERRLAHAGAGGEDHQVRLLEPGRQLVEGPEAGRRAGDVVVGVLDLVEPLERLLEQAVDALEVARDALVGDREHDLLGPVDQLRRLADVLVAERRDVGARADQAAIGRGVADDLGVVAGVGRRRHRRRERVDDRLPADVVEHPAVVERARERDRVDDVALAVHLQDRAVDGRVRPAVEVVGLEQLRDDRDRVLRDQHRAQDRLLGVDVLGRDVGWPVCDRHAAS